MENSVAIHIGSSYTVACTIRNGVYENVQLGKDDMLPSTITLNGEEWTVGIPPGVGGSRPCIHSIKKLIGKTYAEYQKDPSSPVFTGCQVVEGTDGDIRFRIANAGDLSCEDVIVILLKEIRFAACRFRGTEIRSAVVTIPPYFEYNQKNTIRRAINRAGMVCDSLLTEPCAAVLNYVMNSKDNHSDELFLVYDIGGGLCDVSLIRKSKEVLETVETLRDTTIGGDVFNRIITQYVLSELKRLYGIVVNPSEGLDAKRYKRLYERCAMAKRELSSEYYTEINVSEFMKNKEETFIEFTLELMNTLLYNTLVQSFRLIDAIFLANREYSKDDVTKVFLVGGSSRLRAVRMMMSTRFAKEKICDENANFYVVHGAACYLLMRGQEGKSLRIMQRLHFAIGIRVFGKFLYRLFEKNSLYPCSKTIPFTVFEKECKEMKSVLYAGEMNQEFGPLHACDSLMTICFPIPKRKAVVLFLFCVDEDGMLTVTCRMDGSDAVLFESSMLLPQ